MKSNKWPSIYQYIFPQIGLFIKRWNEHWFQQIAKHHLQPLGTSVQLDPSRVLVGAWLVGKFPVQAP